MKTSNYFKLIIASIFLMVSSFQVSEAATFKKDKKQQEDPNLISYTGKILDSESGDPLVFASITVLGKNIATVSNTEGKFIIKVSKDLINGTLSIAHIGYETKQIPFSDLKKGKKNTIRLNSVSVNLAEVKVIPNNPRLIINKVLENRSQNYSKNPVLMTSFYRETIKKRRSYVGISEAVVNVYKEGYHTPKTDKVQLFKARKSSNVAKMDTLLFKLQGGPYGTLMLDIVKDPYLLLEEEILDQYDFNFVNITRIDGRLNYVIEFKQKPYVTNPLFYGRYYIDVDKFAITNVNFNLNTENETETGKMFVKKKPMGVRITPTMANYFVSYKESNGLWYYNYSRGEVEFNVKWKKKLFSTTYSTSIEMAITDWEMAESKTFKEWDKLKSTVVMTEAAQGFANDDFWGEYNTIEPELAIELAIKKIKRKLK